MSFDRKLLTWLATGRTGASSKSMACAAAGLDQGEYGGDFPYDPSDLNRCLLLLDAVPEVRQHFDKIAAISTPWSKFISRWDEIEKCFLDEAGFDWSKSNSAPKTYDLMKEIRDDLF